MPPPMTAQVATVRHNTSVPAKFQIASRQATTATRMQALVVQKDIFVTMRGLRKPLLNYLLSCFAKISFDVIAKLPERLPNRRVPDRAELRPLSATADGGHHRRSTNGSASCHPADRRRT